MNRMSKRDEQKGTSGQQQGKPASVEGRHGDKTHARFQEQLHSGAREQPDSDTNADAREQSTQEGER
jgi:hypothetical protein